LSRIAAERFPQLDDPIAAILAGEVCVDGFPVRNPDSLVARDASIVLRAPQVLAGEAKLRAAIDAFAPAVAGRVAIDVGASTGGFTRVLLAAGARRVYAVDAGHGQLLGSLRQESRVVNLEATNLGELSRELVPEPIEVVTIDVSYVSLAEAVPQLETLEFAAGAELIALVKPMFELGLDAPPPDSLLPLALERATHGIERAPWSVVGAIASPVTGHRGAKELLAHARRR
jgi:23S rRNA (cytidine1920-2'-O)/16S rRNA (cytidine1409-2'-O)-methyltransferase